MSGTWYGRYHTADFADSSVLYGNTILFCKKFRKTPFMVSWNKFIKKTSGQFCAEESYDDGNKTPHYGNCNSNYGDWISLYEKCACWENLPDRGMGLPCVIFFPESKNCKCGKQDTGRCKII